MPTQVWKWQNREEEEDEYREREISAMAGRAKQQVENP